MAITTALNKIKNTLFDETFYKVIQGGMSSGKTFGILTLLISYAQTYEKSVITIVGKSYGHLKDGAASDFKKILNEVNLFDENRWNKSDMDYKFLNGSVIQFRSVDKMGAHGPRRDVLFINEANAISYDVFDQLASRTRDFVIIDYNPSAKFWAHEELVEKKPDDTSFLILTYKDNEALSNREILNIEGHRPKENEEPSNWWIVYGLGQIGSLEGNVYSGWIEMDEEEIRNNARLIRYGLDFGFSNDETALVSIYEFDDGKIGIIEELYEKKILNSQYAGIFEDKNVDKNVLIVADSARPETIAEIKANGYRIIGADKNAGSVIRGIDRVSEKQIVYYGKDLKREYLSYAWRKKRTGEILDEPNDGNDHLMDALRYAIDDLNRKRFDF